MQLARVRFLNIADSVFVCVCECVCVCVCVRILNSAGTAGGSVTEMLPLELQ